MSQPTKSTVFLFSSNRRPKYFDDCLQAVMLPRSMILHFRYRSSHLDTDLLDSIKAGTAVDRNVMVCYVYQEYANGEWQPKSLRPLRSGTVVAAQFLGPEVHIYFAVEGYPISEEGLHTITELANKAFKKENKFCFGSVGDAIDPALVSSTNQDASAFVAVVDQLQKDELRSLDEANNLVQMDPLFYRVPGIYQRDRKDFPEMVEPTSLAGVSDFERGYLITNSRPLELRVQFHQPLWSAIDKQHITLDLKADGKAFSLPKDVSMPIASLYDQNVFYVLPIRDNSGWITRIGFEGEDRDGKPTDSVTKFQALVHATPIVPSAVVRGVAALSPMVTVSIALLSLVVAVFGNADSLKVFAKIPPLAWIAIALLALITLAIPTANAFIQTYSSSAKSSTQQ